MHLNGTGQLTALLRWLVLGAIVGVACGSASALFLALLERATDYRTTHTALVFLLPAAGLLLGTLYERFGAALAGGTDRVIRTIARHGPMLPVVLAPMVLFGTVATHLFGGSAGREGTAVQMGAALSDWISERLGLTSSSRRQLLIAGVAGGFGSVFGTPLAGLVFSLEFLRVGRRHLDALVPALAASVIGDFVTRGWGVGHAAYPALPHVPMTASLAGKWLLVSVMVAAVAVLFIELTGRLRAAGVRWLPRLPLRMAAGGGMVVLLWQLLGTDRYLGLGVPTILRAFSDPALPLDAFAWKLLFTSITLAAGFLGGEVTPLFFIGATLGNASARLLDIPLALGAGVGLAAVFGAAAKTPLALTVMAAELLGVAILPHAALVCVLASLLVGRRSIYGAQLLGDGDAPPPPPATEPSSLPQA